MSLTRNPFFSNEFYFFKAVINPLLLMTLSLSTVIVNKIQFLLCPTTIFSTLFQETIYVVDKSTQKVGTENKTSPNSKRNCTTLIRPAKNAKRVYALL